MISIDSLLYNIDMSLNKVAAFQNQEIPLENKLIAINRSVINLIKTKMGTNNPDRLGFDSFKKRYEDLQLLVEPPHLHGIDLEPTSDKFNKWQADVSSLTPKYMFYIDAYALADKGDCKDRIINTNRDLAKHADVSTLFNNTNTKPSFEYQETFLTLSNDKIEVYTDGTFEFTKLYVSYLRYPKEADKEGYFHLDESPSVSQDVELPEFLESELLNLVLKELAIDTENIPAVNLNQQRTSTQE